MPQPLTLCVTTTAIHVKAKQTFMSSDPAQHQPRRATLYGQLGITPTTSQHFKSAFDVRSHNGDIPSKLADCDQEVAKQNEEPVKLDEESCQRPAKENEDDSSGECGGALEFLRPGEKD